MYFVKNHTKTKKTPPTVWNAQNLHTLDSHIILKLSVSIIKLSTLRGENPAYAALSEQKDSDKRKTVLPYKKFFTKFSLRLLASLGAKLTCGFWQNVRKKRTLKEITAEYGSKPQCYRRAYLYS